jgi:uncharacterized protein
LGELEARAESSGPLEWDAVVRTGGFPRAVSAAPEQRIRLLDDYVQVYASRDVREVLEIESPERFERFLRLLAARTGQELNASGLANDLAIPVNTVRRWIDALQRSYLVELVPAFSRNASERVIRSPKVFMVDPAFALAAARQSSPSGFHLENLVANDLAVWRETGPGRALYHWRLGTGTEVDFVVELESHLLAVEVKSVSTAELRDSRHLQRFREQYPDAVRTLLLTCDPDIRELRSGVIAAPWWSVV